MSDQAFYLFSAVLLGLVIGALIMYFASGKGSNSAKTVELEEKLKTYQEDVVQHFEKTADLVDDLTQSYKKVFDHLGNSARDLMTEDQLQLQMEKRKGKKVTLEFLPLAAGSSQEDLFDELVDDVENQEVKNQEIELNNIEKDESVDLPEISSEQNLYEENNIEEASKEALTDKTSKILKTDSKDENSYT